jgi:hypothetical protein
MGRETNLMIDEFDAAEDTKEVPLRPTEKSRDRLPTTKLQNAMSGSSTKKSLSRQLEEESRRVKEGKSPEKRTIRNNTLVEAEAAPSTNAHEDGDEEVPVTTCSHRG